MSVEHTSQFFHSPKPNGALASVISGLGGTIESYEPAILSLQSRGFDVIAFQYDRSVFTAGDPSLMPNLIDDITAKVAYAGENYERIVSCGASLGAFIGFNVQRNLKKATQGIYGTAGIPISRVLRSVWHNIEIDPKKSGLRANQSLIMVNGKMDRIINFSDAERVMDSWKNNGDRVEFHGMNYRGHLATIKWYKQNMHVLLNRSEALARTSTSSP
jgi:predicted esterase